MTLWHGQNHFFPGGLNVNFAYVKNNNNYVIESILDVVPNSIGHLTAPDTIDTTINSEDFAYDKVSHAERVKGPVVQNKRRR